MAWLLIVLVPLICCSCYCFRKYRTWKFERTLCKQCRVERELCASCSAKVEKEKVDAEERRKHHLLHYVVDKWESQSLAKYRKHVDYVAQPSISGYSLEAPDNKRFSSGPPTMPVFYKQ